MSFEIIKCSDAYITLDFQDQIFADFDEVEVKVVQGTVVKQIYTKTGGEITAGTTPNEAALTLPADDTCELKCGAVFFQIKTMQGVNVVIELSGEGKVINSY